MVAGISWRGMLFAPAEGNSRLNRNRTERLIKCRDTVLVVAPNDPVFIAVTVITLVNVRMS